MLPGAYTSCYAWPIVEFHAPVAFIFIFWFFRNIRTSHIQEKPVPTTVQIIQNEREIP